MKTKSTYLLLFTIMFMAIISCTQKKVYVSVLPENTPKGAQIFLAGNFNNWNPSDPNYLLKYDVNEKKYWTNFPIGFGKIEYKFTRGDWTTVETDSCGGEFGNRTFITSQTNDWIDNSIASWSDLEPINCTKMVLVIDSIPENSPKNAPIFLIGNINNWSLGNTNYKFIKEKNGKYYLTVFKQLNTIEFKLNRGFNETVEANKFGREGDVRTIDFGKKDTIHFNIHAWLDLPKKNTINHTFIIEKLPANTPKNSCIYLTADFNNWNPFDKNLLFSKIVNGKCSLTIAFSDTKMHEFKITRGGWDFEETDENYNPLSNHQLNIMKSDTTRIVIKNWFDKAPKYTELIKKRASALEILLPGIIEILKPEPKEIPEKISVTDKGRKVVFIVRTPNNTGVYDKIFLAGDFNGWDSKDDRYMFKKVAPGKYTFTLRLNDNNAHEYKIVNGDWQNEEANFKNEKLNNRYIECCKNTDTIQLTISNWLNYNTKRKVVFIIENVPNYSKEPIYLTGNFNNWNEKDEKYRFSYFGDRKQILYLFDFDKNYQFFKITKGSWNNEFIDKNGNIYSNLPFKNFLKNDTIRFEIFNWKN